MSESATLDRPVHLLRSDRATVSMAPLQTHCATCRVSVLCLPGALCESDLRPLDALRLATRSVSAGETIYRPGDRFRFIYAVREGTCKTSLTTASGREQVADFHLPGEVMGLDAVAANAHGTTATALEDSEICMIPYDRLSSLTAASPGTPDLLGHLMSQEIVRGNRLIALLGPGRAASRLAAFVVNLSQRYAARGCSPREFHLRMSREEIGSYLSLNLATVSRTFSIFQQRGFVKVQGRHLSILDLDGFRREYGLGA